MSSPPLLRRLAYDPILDSVKLIAEAWDAGGLYQVGRFPACNRWAEWNGSYRDVLRSFLKGEYWQAPEAAHRLTGSQDLYRDGYRGYNSSVNFLTCHDGFTLYDLYAYNEKHNEANGWDNTDGASDNRGWNCGAEGETLDPQVNILRRKLIKNACAALMCSRGTPMFLAGDEFCNTQFGNNNTYCQDNEVSWLDWSLLEKNHEIFSFFKFMIAFRKAHPAITRELAGALCGYPSMSCYNGAGEPNITTDTKTLGVLYAGYLLEEGRDDLVYAVFNPYWEEQEMMLPQLPGSRCWYLNVNTGAGETGECYEAARPWIEQKIRMKPRSAAVFSAQ